MLKGFCRVLRDTGKEDMNYKIKSGIDPADGLQSSKRSGV